MYCARHGMHAWDGIIAYDAAIWCEYIYVQLFKQELYTFHLYHP